MGVSIVDGTLEEVVIRRHRKQASVYERLMFRLPDGSKKTWTKAVVAGDLVPLLTPGTSGRFYLYTAIDHRGVHGVRLDDGRELYAYSKLNEYVSSAVVISQGLLTLLSYSVDFGLGFTRILAPILFVLGIPMYFLYRNTRLQAERQYREDQGHGAAAAGG